MSHSHCCYSGEPPSRLFRITDSLEMTVVSWEMQSGVGRSGMGEELRTSVELGQLRDLGSKGGGEIVSTFKCK